MTLSDIKNYFNKIVVFYFPAKAGYWNSITKCTLKEKPVKLGRYYLDFSTKINYPGSFSKDGIPLYSYPKESPIEHPIVIAQYAFGLYEKLFKNDFSELQLKDKFLMTAEWFDKNKVEVNNGFGWYIHHDFPEIGLNYPFISAMSQGEAISVLTRAALLTSNSKFEQLAEQALSPFELDVKDGGVVNYFKSFPIYEEGPSPIRACGVLNGFIFSLFGIYDLILLNGNQQAMILFEKGISALKKLLQYYDIKLWTRYSLFDYPRKYYSSLTYHIIVTEQLKALYMITEEKIFLEYFKKWEGYSKSFLKKSFALYNKLMFSNKLFSS
jgi:hypothetical protein